MKLRERYQTFIQLYRNRYAAKPEFKPKQLDSQQQAWLEELRVKGAVMIPNFLSDSECDNIKDSISVSIQEFKNNQTHLDEKEQSKFGYDMPSGFSVWKDVHESDFRIIKSEKQNPLIARFNQDTRLSDLGTNYLKADLHVKFTMCNRLEYRPKNLGSGGGWHRDMMYKRGFKAMVYLTDVDEKSGPFQFIPGSSASNFHLANVLKVDQYQFSHEEVLGIIGGDEQKIFSCIAPKGTLLIFETNMIHRGKPISEGHSRFAMTNYYNW